MDPRSTAELMEAAETTADLSWRRRAMDGTREDWGVDEDAGGNPCIRPMLLGEIVRVGRTNRGEVLGA